MLDLQERGLTRHVGAGSACPAGAIKCSSEAGSAPASPSQAVSTGALLWHPPQCVCPQWVLGAQAGSQTHRDSPAVQVDCQRHVRSALEHAAQADRSATQARSLQDAAERQLTVSISWQGITAWHKQMESLGRACVPELQEVPWPSLCCGRVCMASAAVSHNQLGRS